MVDEQQQDAPAVAVGESAQAQQPIATTMPQDTRAVEP